MKISFLAIGDELLNGRTLEKNLFFLGRYILRKGVELTNSHIYRDEGSSLKKAILKHFEENDLLILSGGLGPTLDDITKNILAECFSLELAESELAAKIAFENYERKNLKWHKELNSYHIIPKGFIALENKKGLAPALLYKDQKSNKLLLSAPGVPSEFEAIIETHLDKLLPTKKTTKASLCIRTKGIPEEKIFNQLCPNLWSELSNFGKVQSLPGRFGVDIVVGNDILPQNEKNFLEQIKSHVHSSALDPYVWEYGERSLEEILVALLKEKNCTLALAESCTGGLVSSIITDVPGSSKVFKGSIICYQNEIKEKELDISPKLLLSKGAVNAELAELLSLNILKKYNSTFGLAIVGEAGPEASSNLASVGTVFISVSSTRHGRNQTKTQNFSFKGDRSFLKNRFALMALSLLFDQLKEIEK
jgi:nicotinamide-nucleotide amidase